MSTLTGTIQLRRGTAAQWTAANPVLLSGEAGYETNTGKIKFGDGTTAWNSLAYATFGISSGSTNHSALSNLAWTSSGHTGNASGVAAFNSGGNAGYFVLGSSAGTICDGGDSRLSDARHMRLVGSNVSQMLCASTNTDEVMYSVLVPAGTIAAGDFFYFMAMTRNANNGNSKTHKAWINTTADLVTGSPVQIAQLGALTTNNSSASFSKKFAVRSSTSIVSSANGTTSLGSEYTTATATLPTAITTTDLTQAFYFILSSNRSDSLTTTGMDWYQLYKEKGA